MNKVIIIMGSKADLDWAKQISKVLDGNAALASAKILGLSNPEIKKKIIDFQEKKRSELEAADVELVNGK